MTGDAEPIKDWYQASYGLLSAPAPSLTQSAMADGATPHAIFEGSAIPHVNAGRGRRIVDRERAVQAMGGDPDGWAAQIVRHSLTLERSRKPGHRSGAQPLAILRARTAILLVRRGATQRQAARTILAWEDRLPDDPEPAIRTQRTHDAEAALLGSVRDTCRSIGLAWPPPKV